MGKISRLYNYTNGTVADATKLQADLDNMVSGMNATYDELILIAQNAAAGSIPDGSLGVAKVADVFGRDLNIAANPALVHNHDTVYQKKLDGTVTDFNTALTQGEYKVGGTNILNSPTGSLEVYGKLIVKVSDGGTQNNFDNWLWQKFYTTWGDVYTRIKINNATFSPWRKALDVDINNLLTVAREGEALRLDGITHSFMTFSLSGTRYGFVGKGTGGANNIYVASDAGAVLLESGVNHRQLVYDGDGNVWRPQQDNAVYNGGGAYRWSAVFAGSGSINTSDRDHKQQIGPIPDEVLDAWATVNYQQFKFNDAVAEKGEDARFHVGLIAQEIQEAFTARGLDAFKYGLLCYDEWPDQFDDAGNLIKPAGHIYSIRPDECQFLEVALMRRELNILKGGV